MTVDDAKHPPSHAGSFGAWNTGIGTERPRVFARPVLSGALRVGLAAEIFAHAGMECEARCSTEARRSVRT